MELIALYAPDAADFSTLGLGALTPSECTVTWQAAGAYELTLVQPIDETLRWAQLQNGCIISAPVPVRESPLYEYGVGSGSGSGSGSSGSVKRNIWQVARTSVGLYMRSGYGTGYKALRHYPNGTQVIELDRKTVGSRLWIHCSTVEGGETGYMSTKYLDLVETKTETISEGRPENQRVIQLTQSRRQLFRIYSTEQNSDAGVVTVKARHVFYDLAGNMLNGDYSPENVSGAEAARQVFAQLRHGGDFTLYTEGLSGGSVTGDYSYKNPVEILLDPDEGIVSQCSCQIIRDNFDVHLIDDIESDMGVTVRRGKNLVGVTVTTDDSDVVTQIKPCGKDADGNPFWLADAEGDGRYVNSSNIGSYPVTRTVKRDYDVTLVKKDEDNETTFRDNAAGRAAAREKLRALAVQDFADGADLPSYGMDVDFILLQGEDGDMQYAGLQAVHPYDTVTVADSMLGLTAKLRVTGYEWNALNGQYDSVTLGEIQALDQKIYSYNLPTGGVSGTKIAPGTASGSILRDATIQYAKISVAAIEQLSAEAIVAITAHINEIVAEKVTTDALYAAFAELIALKAGTITADNITTDTLAAELARITVLSCGSATFDRATVTHLVSEAMNLEYGVAGQVFIRNLAVEYAQMIGATIGNLCIKASDGNYYSIDVDENGNVSATKTTVSSGEISAGQTSGGRVILETNILASNLNTSNLLATYALINKIDAARIDVAELFAQKAFIDQLTTSQIIGGKSLTIIAGEASDALNKVDNLQIGGRNLLLKSATKHLSANAGAALTFTDGVSVSEWGATDAIQCTGSGGTTRVFGMLTGVSANAISVINQAYVHSIYLKNDGVSKIGVNNNMGAAEYVESGEAKRIAILTKGNGISALQINLTTETAGDAINITYWHPKIELGNTATDWSPAPEDVDDDFAKTVTKINDLQKQIDGNITTWFYDAVPTTTNAPAKDWTTDALKSQHLGDLYYDKSGYCYRWQLSGGVYSWTRITDTDVTKALEDAAIAKDTADGKRRVFVVQPTPPYDVGDMWAQGESGELLRCATAKAAGASYAASDWVKASKYTDDTIAKAAQEKIDNLQIGGRNLLLKSATKHLSANAGATLAFADGVSVDEWGATDAIQCTGNGGTTRIFGFLTGVSANAISVLNQAYVHSIYLKNDGVRKIGVNNNMGVAEYVEVGEAKRIAILTKGNGISALQINLTTENAGDAIDITYWHPKIELGNTATDWTPAPEDVDDDFAKTVTKINDLQNQIDGNITTWFYDAVPTTSNAPAVNWTTDALKKQHLGDLYYDKNGYCYRWQLSGEAYGWTRITDTDVTKALSDAAIAKDTADGKRRVFVDTPKPPYDVGDMWAQGESGELLRCAKAKKEVESYDASDWVKASKYTDDTIAKAAQEKIDNLQIGGRNLLLKSATKHLTANAGAALTFTDGVSVSEWGATDAIQCTGNGGSSTIFGIMEGGRTDNASINGQSYTHSIYIRNNGSERIRISNNIGSGEYVEGGESRRVVLFGKGNGSSLLQLNFIRETAGAAIDITYWHPKIELGNLATDWSPAPEDNPEIITGINPPTLPIRTGTLWIDTGVTPTVIRRWKGTSTSTDRDDDGWNTVSDLEEINEISNKLAAQQAEAQKAIDQLATAITIDTSGAHFYKPGYRDRSEVRIDQNSVDILVNGSVNSSFIAGGLILGNYMLWHPAAAGGLAFNLYSEA